MKHTAKIWVRKLSSKKLWQNVNKMGLCAESSSKKMKDPNSDSYQQRPGWAPSFQNLKQKNRRLETLILFSLFASASTAWLWKMGGGGSREIGSLTLNLFFPMFWPCTSFPSCVHWQLPHINTVKMSHLYLILSNKNAESHKDDKSKKIKIKFAAY